jgi:hypothetical protein
VRRPFVLTALVVLACAVSPLRAMFVGDAEDAPVDRLVSNLTRLTEREPQNVTYRLNLARVHAMAYARQADVVRVMRGREELGPWPSQGFAPGDLDRAMPEVLEGARSAPQGREHLTAALASFQAVLAIEPTHAIARLGHAWCLQESGDRARAITEYRALIADLRPRAPAILPIVPLLVREAEGYLIALLDPARDAADIAQLQADLATRIAPRVISPIVIPLRDGLNPDALLDDAARIHFDADGTAVDREWTWISNDAAWLVYDACHTGRITSALQLFGNVTFLLFWENGYQALRALDDDGDGVLRGHELDGLALWHDVNHNGVSDAGEARPLSAWHIVALSTRHEVDTENAAYIASSSAGVTFADGSTRPTYDILLRGR